MLPFDTTCTVYENGTARQALVPITVWPATGQRTADSGEVFTHTAEAKAGRDHLLATGHNLEVDVLAGGISRRGRFRVVEAVAQDFPFVHVDLTLYRVTPGG